MAKNVAQTITNNESAEVFKKPLPARPNASNVTTLTPRPTRPSLMAKILSAPRVRIKFDAGDFGTDTSDDVEDGKSVDRTTADDSAFPVDAFGDFQESIEVIAEQRQAHVEMVSGTLLTCVAALAQPLVSVAWNQGGESMPVSLNLLMMGESGERKSSTIKAIMGPVEAVLRQHADQRKLMKFSDTSIEGLINHIVYRCPSVFLLATEGASLLGGHAMNRDNLMRFLATTAALYSGESVTKVRAQAYVEAYDRKLSMLIAAQPTIAYRFIGNKLIMDQGQGNRFLFSTPPSLLGQRKMVFDNLHELSPYLNLKSRLETLASAPWTTDLSTGGMITRAIYPCDEARETLAMFADGIQEEMRPGGEFADQKNYATRMPEQVLRIAAVLAMLDDPCVEVISDEVMERACNLGSFYLDTAMKLLRKAPANEQEQDAGTLLEWMRSKMVEQDLAAIPARVIYKDGPRCARPSKRAQELLTILVARGDVVPYEHAIQYGEGKRSNDNYRPA